MTIHWKSVEQYFTVELFVFPFHLVCNFGKFINFVLGTVRNERVEVTLLSQFLVQCHAASDIDQIFNLNTEYW